MTKKRQTLQAIDKPHYGYWQAMYLSFYSPKLYVDVAKRWKGLGLLYLFFTFALFLLPLAGRISYEFKTQINKQFIDPLKAMPLLFVHDGRLIFDKPMPFFIKNKVNQVVGIIDTTGIISTKTSASPKLIALLNEKQISFWPPSAQDFVQTIPSLNQMVTKFGGSSSPMSDIFAPFNKLGLDNKPVTTPYPNPNEVYDVHEMYNLTGLNKLIIIFTLLIYPSLVLFVFSLSFLLLLTFAMMGQLIALLFFRFRLRYGQACRILSVAYTPAIAFYWLSLFLGLAFTGLGLLTFCLASLYFCYGVLSLQRESKQVVRA